jgi:hypothetical protein
MVTVVFSVTLDTLSKCMKRIAGCFARNVTFRITKPAFVRKARDSSFLVDAID